MPRKGQRGLPIQEFEARLSSVSKIDWARLASFIDGEGTIYINRCRPHGRHKSVMYSLSVVITNSSLVLLNWLQGTFGGSVYAKDFHGKNKIKINRPTWVWHLNELQADAILRRCMPYFIVKRQQAEIGIAFRDLKAGGRRFVKVSSDSLQQREELRNKIHILNSPQCASAVAARG